MDEFEIIEQVFAPLADKYASFSLKDDAAYLADGNLVVTMDTLVAGVHFFPEDAPADIAIKAMGVNLSDLAAKGATPYRYLLSLSLTKSTSSDWLSGFAQGLQKEQDRSGCQLIGGDTTSTAGPLTISITMLGKVGKQGMIQRSTAQAGDLLFVSGSIGDAVAGLALRQNNLAELEELTEKQKDYFLNRYLYPAPRLELIDLLNQFATASMDISDGLVGDADKLAKASGKGVKINLDAIPLAEGLTPIADRSNEIFSNLMTGGDDYEILFTANARDKSALEAWNAKNNLRLTCFGEMTEKSETLELFSSRGRKVLAQNTSYKHF